MALTMFENDIKKLKATFEVEGMRLSDDTIKELEKVAEGTLSGYDLIERLKQKYVQRA